MDAKRTQEIKARYETLPEKWHVVIYEGMMPKDGSDFVGCIVAENGEKIYSGAFSFDAIDSLAIANFIAQARQDIPDLVDDVEHQAMVIADLEHERKDNDALLWKVAEQQKEIERLRAQAQADEYALSEALNSVCPTCGEASNEIKCLREALAYCLYLTGDYYTSKDVRLALIAQHCGNELKIGNK